MTIYNIELSTTEPFNYTKLIKIRQDDTESQTFNVEVTENGKVLDLSNYNVLMVSRPNGFLVKEPITNPSNLNAGKFSHTISSSFWQKLGQNDAWFSFEQNGVVKDSTTNFSYLVIEGDCRNIPQGNYLWDLEELKRKFEEMGLDLSNNYNDFKSRLDVLLEMFKTMNTYSKEEIDHMLIKLLAGEKISATFTMDFKNKVAGSLVENPNIAKWVHHEDLLIPSNTAYKELSQAYYNQLNDDVFSVNATDANKKAIMLSSFNILEDLKRKFPSLFSGLTSSQQVALVKKYITKSYPSIYAKGSNSAGNKATLNLFSPTENKYVVASTNNTDTIKKFGLSLSAYATSFYMDSNGVISTLANAEPSDGKTPSSLSIDYVSLHYTVELSLKDIFATKEELELAKTEISKLKTYVDTELAKKQNKLSDTGWLPVTLLNGWKGDMAVRQINGVTYHRGYLQSASGNGNMSSVAFAYPSQIIMFGSETIGFAAPSGEMDGNLNELKMTGLLRMSNRDCYVWFKNTVGKCYFDSVSFNRT